MFTDLGGIDRKLERARAHLDSVKAEEDAWIDVQREFITVKADLDPSPFENMIIFSLFVEAVVPISKRVATIVGDCIQNLRAALDQLAWQLVLANGGTPDEHTLFPLYEDRIVQNGKKAKVRKIDLSSKVDPNAFALIEEAQPYHRVEGPTEHPLWILNELSNVDRQRLLILIGEGSTDYRVWVGSASNGAASHTSNGCATAFPLRAGTKFGGIGVGPGDFRQYPCVKGDLSPRVAFGEGEVCALQPVTDVLEELTKAVWGVIDSLRIYALPAAFRAGGNPLLAIPEEGVARHRALTEARGEVWPWTEGPLGVPADHEWLASLPEGAKRLPPGPS